ncbi:major facilitator superfamily domain-containing protein [Ephemerocybe angulata]|uniref:Major facilitator superfamily domain-containing protein n=1 Tax=Ephemerocybe angulata TaxID=980116 RepID=A0A8H6IFT1_9AGAR|nr:major facilitator superfamily domain-containing protein [Tulosesus angulatus]
MSTSRTDSLEKDTSSIEKIESNLDFDPAFERRTLFQVDLRVLPLLSLLCAFNSIDKSNLGLVYAAGMGETLNLTAGSRYTLVACMYSVPFILLQLPGTLGLRRFGVRNWLTFMVGAWGAVALSMGFVKSWQSLLVTRMLLGTFQAPFFASLLWIIAAWYRRDQIQKRTAVWYLISLLMNAFSPLIAYGLSLLDGKRGLEGWRWIFIVEGTITLVLACLSFFFLPCFPEQNKFLTKEQTALIIRRIDEDRGDALPDVITFQKVRTHLSDWTLWGYGFIVMCGTLPIAVQGFFVPIILGGMGYDSKGVLLRVAASFTPAVPTTMAVAYFADKYQHRSSFIAGGALLCVLGNSLLAWHQNDNVRYFGVFLTNAANSAATTSALTWASTNVVSHSKRAVQTAVVVALAELGFFLASTVFRSQDAPRYIPGLIATLVSQGVVLLLLCAIVTRHWYRNKQMREGKLTAPLEGQEGFYYTF